MLHVRGFAAYFPKIGQIEAEKVALRIGFKGNPRLLKNKIANRILYSHAIAQTQEELKIDLAILFEAVKLSGDLYYKKSIGKIFIPEGLANNFPDIKAVSAIFIEALKPKVGTEVALSK